MPQVLGLFCVLSSSYNFWKFALKMLRLRNSLSLYITNSMSWILMTCLMALLVFSEKEGFALERSRAINCMVCCSNLEQAFIQTTEIDKSPHLSSHHTFISFSHVQSQEQEKNILLKAVKCYIINEAYVMKKYGLESNITELKGKGTLLRGNQQWCITDVITKWKHLNICCLSSCQQNFVLADLSLKSHFVAHLCEGAVLCPKSFRCHFQQREVSYPCMKGRTLSDGCN